MINFKDKMKMKSSVVLLNLLQISLGNSANWKVKGSVDWKEVIGKYSVNAVLCA